MQEMEKDVPKYFSLKNEIILKYCNENIMKSQNNIILMAEGKYEQIVLWDEIFNIGDKIVTSWLSGDRTGVVKSIKVYFSTVSWELEWEMKVRNSFNKVITVCRQNSPHLVISDKNTTINIGITEIDISSYTEQFKVDRETAVKEIKESLDLNNPPFTVETVFQHSPY